LKGGERLGDKEGSEEEEEVNPAWLKTPEVRPLTSGDSFGGNRLYLEPNGSSGRVARRERKDVTFK
jgi:hypothetical protein